MDVDVSSAVPHSKHMEDLIIESSKFPAAQPPDPNLPSKIETEYWPCPPSLAVIGNTLSHYLIFFGYFKELLEKHQLQFS